MSYLALAVLLLLAGIAALVAELFLPSGGVLGFVSLACVIGSVVFAFMEGMTAGTVFLIVVVVALPALWVVGVRIWPYTPIGKLIAPPLPERPEDVLPDTDEYRSLVSLVGKQGVAKSKMLLGGDIEIDRRIYDAVSAGEPIDPGEPVQVIAVRTNRLVVRRVTKAVDTLLPKAEIADASPDGPLDEVIEDPFEEG